jgi:hypothetical protein
LAIARLYTPEEISRILRNSEGVAPPGSTAEGHAEGKHALARAGRRRAATSVEAMVDRLFDHGGTRPPPPVVSAFETPLHEILCYALNTKSGQTALALLGNPNVAAVEACFDVGRMNYRVYRAERAHGPLPAPGADGKLPRQHLPLVAGSTRAEGIWTKLMRGAHGDLHIQTAFPLDTLPADVPRDRGRCFIRVRVGQSQQIEL